MISSPSLHRTAVLLALLLMSAAQAVPTGSLRLPEDTEALEARDLDLLRALARPRTIATIAVPDSPANAAYVRGIKALSREDLATARSAFEEGHKLDAQAPHVLLGLAEIAFREQDLASAARWIRAAQDAAPDYAEVQASRGRLHLLEGHPEAAMDAWRAAIRLDPSALRSRMDLADLLSSRGRLDEAITLYEEVIVHDPNHGGAHYALGIARARGGDAAGGRAALERAHQLAPDNPLPLLGLARLAAGAGEHDAALRQIDAALVIHPTMTGALLLKGDLLDLDGQVEAALTAYDAAATAAPDQAGAPLKRAMLEHRLGRTEAAMRSYQAALARDERLAVACNNLAALALEQPGQLAQAETWARQAVTLEPTNAEFLDTLASVLQARGEATAAIASLEQAVALAPDAPELQYRLAELYIAQGADAAGRTALEAALAQPADRHFPSRAAALALRARLGAP